MVTLYHVPAAICAQKVRVCLAEKGVPYDTQDVTGQFRSAEYLKLNPAGYVPTLVHEQHVITESRVISEYVDESFDGPPLQPADPYLRSVMRRWTKQIDESLHPFIFVLSFVPLFRDNILKLPEETRSKAYPLDPVKADRMRDMVERGWDSPWLRTGLQRFHNLVGDLEGALEKTEWLAGDTYSLADADYTPYLQRMEDLGLSWLWADKPALTAWYTRVRARASFSAVIKDWAPPEERRDAEERAKQIATQYRSIFMDSSGRSRAPAKTSLDHLQK